MMQTAKEIMTTDVVTVPASASVAQAIELMREKKLRDLIVEPYSRDDSHGIVTETDIVYKVAAYGINPQRISVSEVMTKPCIEVDPDLTVQEVAQLFANHHLHRAPVVKDRLLGIITVFDIVRETMWWQG
jgi:CBS domain-containing protein